MWILMPSLLISCTFFFFFDKLFPAKRLSFFTDWIFRAKTYFFLLKAFAVKRLTFLLTDCFRPKDFPPLLKARVTLQPNIGSCISSSRNVEEILRFLFRISTRWFSKRNNGVSLCLLSRNCNGYLTAYLLISSSPTRNQNQRVSNVEMVNTVELELENEKITQ